MTSPREEPKEKPETSKPARLCEMEEADVANGEGEAANAPDNAPGVNRV